MFITFVTFLRPIGSAVRSGPLGLEIDTGDENLALKFGLLTGLHLSVENQDASKNRFFSPITSFLPELVSVP